MNIGLSNDALVSVIIPCYNHSHYLPAAIESVLQQTYSPVEIIVIDDGSSDNTKNVVQNYPQVIYVYQANQGLSASRNAGIKKSKGMYIVLLDADDWLYADAIKINMGYLQPNAAAAYVSGAYDSVYEEKNMVVERKVFLKTNPYQSMLVRNYIGVPAAVLYRRRGFNEFLFDTTLKSCEDYDLYLKVSRKYPVLHHTDKIAAYRKHSSNMSSDFKVMLNAELEVLARQKQQLKSTAEIKAYKQGRMFWKQYYVSRFYKKLLSSKTKISATDLYFLLKNNLYFFLKFIIIYPLRKLLSKA